MNGRDEFQNLWETYEMRLQESIRLNTVLLRSMNNFHKIESPLRRLQRGVWIEIVLSAVAMLLAGSFIAGKIGQARFAVPGTVLLVAAWLALFSGIRQIVTIGKIAFDEPVVAIQTALERLRLERIRAIYWTLVLSPLLWMALSVVGSRSLGADIYASFPAWLAANAAFAFAVLAAAVIFARRVTAGSSPIADALAGRSIFDARSHLERISGFATDEPPPFDP